VLAVAFGGQQPSPAAAAVIGVCVHLAVHCAAEPSILSTVQALSSSQALGHSLLVLSGSHVSPVSIAPLPHRSSQSLPVQLGSVPAPAAPRVVKGPLIVPPAPAAGIAGAPPMPPVFPLGFEGPPPMAPIPPAGMDGRPPVPAGGFDGSPPVPLGGFEGAPPVPAGGFGGSPPVPLGGFEGAPPVPPGGLAGPPPGLPVFVSGFAGAPPVPPVGLEGGAMLPPVGRATLPPIAAIMPAAPRPAAGIVAALDTAGEPALTLIMFAAAALAPAVPAKPIALMTETTVVGDDGLPLAAPAALTGAPVPATDTWPALPLSAAEVNTGPCAVCAVAPPTPARAGAFAPEDAGSQAAKQIAKSAPVARSSLQR